MLRGLPSCLKISSLLGGFEEREL
ncbi:hypothetical protein Goklo_013278, partial [Gossypium klotzschianum]|nr:hypothetical protein [Gossypium klotzschianum]